MLQDGIVSAAPLYDLLCTLEYPEPSESIGATIGTQQSLAKVDRQALLDEARAMGLSTPKSEQALDELTADIRAGIIDLPTDVIEGWPAHTVIETVQARAARLDSGEPLGGAKPSSRRRRNLDAATATKRRDGP